MKKAFNFFFMIVVFSPMFLGCENTSFDCIKNTGPQITATFDLPEFHSIDAYDGVNIFIKEGSKQELSLEVGENLLDDIEIAVDSEGHLTVKNNNTCNWVRSYQDINLFITTDSLALINQFGYGIIRSAGKWNFPSVTINAKNGVGDIYLEVENQRLYLVTNTIANFYLSGKTENLIIGNYYSDGIFSAANLAANNVSVTHLGSNTIEVNAVESLKGSIQSVGDILYHGEPGVVEVAITGTGNLIKR